jgi:hypothetical protein
MGRPTPLTPEQDKALAARYIAGESRNSLAIAYKVSRCYVEDRVRLYGATYRKYTDVCHKGKPILPLNESAFSDPHNNPEAAYWIGFLMADGCVSMPTYFSNTLHLILQISNRDALHLDNFKKFLGSGHSIQHVPPRGKNHRPMVRLDVASDRLCTDLARFGVIPRKSLIAKCIGLERNRLFWRGVVDGDGWIGVKPPLISLCGSPFLVEQFADFCRSLWKTKAIPYRDKRCTNMVFFSQSNLGAATIALYLYRNRTVALGRKAILAYKIARQFNLV